MYSRTRQGQNFTGNTPQRNTRGNQKFQGANGGQNQQTPFKQQQQQGANNTPFKQQQPQQQGGNNTPFKQQLQTPQSQPQQQTPQPQQQQTPQQQGNTQQQSTPAPPPPPLQQQQQQQLQPQQQPQQQQQPPPQQQPQQTPQRLKPILKNSMNAQEQNQDQNQHNLDQPESINEMNNMDTSENASEVTDSDGKFYIKRDRKGRGVKVNKRLKRLRLNQKLRKTLQPKNAIMVLNEMKTGVHFTFPEQHTAIPNSLFVVHAEIDGKTYIGQGLSKPLARQNAAENALKSLLSEKITAAAMKASTDSESEGTTTNAPIVAPTGEDIENKDSIVKMETNTDETSEMNEIPWSSLASFALYKLFLDWQNQGTVVPIPRPGLSPGKLKKEVKVPVPKELPENPTSIHPVILLNRMLPGLTYYEISRIGNPPTTTFTLGVKTNGQEFTGSAKNKKDAKKLAAKAALLGLYNVNYPEEVVVGPTTEGKITTE